MGVNYWHTYTPVINRIIVRSLLSIQIIHELTIISIDFVLDFTQSDLDVYVFMEITLGMGVDGNRGEWVLKLNKLLYGINQASEHWFDIIPLVYKGGVSINIRLNLVYFIEETQFF